MLAFNLISKLALLSCLVVAGPVPTLVSQADAEVAQALALSPEIPGVSDGNATIGFELVGCKENKIFL